MVQKSRINTYMMLYNEFYTTQLFFASNINVIVYIFWYNNE